MTEPAAKTNPPHLARERPNRQHVGEASENSGQEERVQKGQPDHVERATPEQRRELVELLIERVGIAGRAVGDTTWTPAAVHFVRTASIELGAANWIEAVARGRELGLLS